MTLSMDAQSDDYSESIEKIAFVLRQHMDAAKSEYLSDDTFRFAAAYETFLKDFWSRIEAEVALEDLFHAIQKVCDAYEAVPNLVSGTLKECASGLDWEHQEDFKMNTTADVFFKSSIPKLGATEAIIALETISARRQALLSTINAVKTELPEGMKTRNRPGKAWAVIYAANEISKVGERINVPKAIDRSGPFYRLLVDLFTLFEVEESVQGAFRGWRRHMDGNYENLDLMPI